MHIFVRKLIHQRNREILFCNERKGWKTVIFTELSIYCQNIEPINNKYNAP